MCLWVWDNIWCHYQDKPARNGEKVSRAVGWRGTSFHYRDNLYCFEMFWNLPYKISKSWTVQVEARTSKKSADCFAGPSRRQTVNGLITCQTWKHKWQIQDCLSNLSIFEPVELCFYCKDPVQITFPFVRGSLPYYRLVFVSMTEILWTQGRCCFSFCSRSWGGFLTTLAAGYRFLSWPSSWYCKSSNVHHKAKISSCVTAPFN